MRSADKSVLVVGAGPAGATAALTLARAGVTVRLLDRSNFPRNKPCGGGMSLRVLKRFPYLERELNRIPTHFVGRLRLQGPDGDWALIESDEPAAVMIRRIEFDDLLVSLAVEAGAELVTGAEIVQASLDEGRTVLVTRDGRRFDSRLVIAADGVNSVIAKRLGINRRWPARSVALDMMEETPRTALRDADPSTLWVAYGFDPRGGQSAPTPDGEREARRAHEGYAYIFPKRDHVNVGIGYVLDYYRTSIDAAPYDLQRAFVDHLKRTGEIEGESVRGNFTPFLIPVGGPLARTGHGGVLLAGDAGGFVNGFTAEGIYYAMVSGDLAARTMIETPPAAVARLARKYRRLWDDEIGAELRDSVSIQQYMFRDRRRISGLIEGARRAPSLSRLVVDFARGGLGYRTLRRKLLSRAPLLAARMAWERVNALADRAAGFSNGERSWR